MSVGVCNYHGDCCIEYQSQLNSGHVFEVKEEADLSELVKNALILNRTKEYIHSKINLKDRNVYLIYIVEFGGGKDYCLRDLHSTPSEINVKATQLSLPGVGGTQDVNAKAFILSSPKNYVKESVKVAFENLNMYSEQEFEGFVDLEAVDVNLEKDISRIKLPLMKKMNALDLPIADLEQEEWYHKLDSNQKDLIWRTREGVAAFKKKRADLGGEKKIRENQIDRRERFNKLKERLQQPRCG
jgi:hypothetical protein